VKPRIGVAANILQMHDGYFIGVYRDYVNNDYVDSVAKGGGIPVMLPVIHNLADVKDQISGLDGIILTGGYDVDPALYGEETRQECGFIMREIDEFYVALVHAADELGIKVLGICKGAQVLNIAYGGSLYQDIASQCPNALKHVQQAPRYDATQTIQIKEGSFLYDVFGKEERVNSFHHQSVKTLGRGLKLTAETKDHIVEGFEKEDGTFMCGVQFHPEMMATFDHEDMIRLFTMFFKK
jgi:putative glutamine amidotransferase